MNFLCMSEAKALPRYLRNFEIGYFSFFSFNRPETNQDVPESERAVKSILEKLST